MPHGDSIEQPVFTLRRRDRRRSLDELVCVLSRALGDRSEGVPLRSVFEDTLRRMLPVRSIRLTDRMPRQVFVSNLPPTVESMAVEVPTPGARAILEVAFGPGSPLGEWDRQLLHGAAQVAALILEVERVRALFSRDGHGTTKVARDGAAPLIGSTPVMQALRAEIERVSWTDFTVLLEGESGVGKELVARQIHALSRRSDGPFVAVNCAAIVETLLESELFGIEERTATGVKGRRGKFEHADGGTLFLDEVSDLSLSAQAKLLRVIQDLSVERVGGQSSHRVDIRIVAATNRGLGVLVERRLFRHDLFYRLSGVDIRVPALRERREDILELAHYFLDRHKATRPLALSDLAAEALVRYDWPGNVRELERLIERAVALTRSDVIEVDDLPSTVRGEFAEILMPALQRNDTMRAWGSHYARLVLGRCRGNKRKASRALGISYHTLNSYLRYRPCPLPKAAHHQWSQTEECVET